MSNHWLKPCCNEDRDYLAEPWVHKGRLYASDGCMLVSFPALPGETAAIGLHQVVGECVELLRAASVGESHQADFWGLVRWAGPQRTLDRVCESCDGTGMVGWVPDGEGYGELVDPSYECPGVAYAVVCSECEGVGYWASAAVPVSIHGVVVYARLLARALWALCYRGMQERVQIFPVGDRLYLRCDDGEALIMGMRGAWVREWPKCEVTP